MIKTLAALALALASLPAAAAPSCPAVGSRLPFPLPSEELSSEWADLEWELWEATSWEAFCSGRADSLVCICAKERGAY